ncbi:hypothetical protein Vadar_011845 [Vaccinium darrowii]|uniref:Uncharacterized protein n=1 Tax=Vaccinium darrowii TaxID=229202 RepID=A0ACB7ZBZ5_9ERIC|nr:hypothetical protein Vadar_011845 [Vaccinium darrowii]
MMTSSRTTVVHKRSTSDDPSTAEARSKRQKIVEDEAERGLVLVSGMNAVTQKRGRRDDSNAERLKRVKVEEEDGDFASVLEHFKTLELKEGSSLTVTLQVKEETLEQERTLEEDVTKKEGTLEEDVTKKEGKKGVSKKGQKQERTLEEDVTKKEGTLEEDVTKKEGKKGVSKKGQKVPFPAAPILYCPCGAGVCRTRRTRTGRDSCRTFFSCPAYTSDLRGCAFLEWRQDRFKDDGSSTLMYSTYLHQVVEGEDRMTYKRCFRCRVAGHLKEECKRG